MKTVDDINFRNKKVLVRVDFNVPLNDRLEVTDEIRIASAIPTIKKIIEGGGSAILMSHLGRPKGVPVEKYSLKNIIPNLSNLLGIPVKFVNDCVGNSAEAAAAELHPGEVLLLENVRFHKNETQGDPLFAKALSVLGDIYINDAFGTAHRAHASTTLVSKYFKEVGCGYIMKKELENADKVLKNIEKPYCAILGGAKISDKILVIERLLDKLDHLLIGGGMSYTFFSAMGNTIGKSLVELDKRDIALQIISKAKSNKVQIHLPVDSVISRSFDNHAESKIENGQSIPEDWMGLDIGPLTINKYIEIILKSKTILWNGPMGAFEMSSFAQGTEKIAQAVAKATQQGAFSLVGGGDSAAAINQLGYASQVGYVSTGGGALLEYMEGKVLPGIAALETKG